METHLSFTPSTDLAESQNLSVDSALSTEELICLTKTLMRSFMRTERLQV